jgi:hypothetical protein
MRAHPARSRLMNAYSEAGLEPLARDIHVFVIFCNHVSLLYSPAK